MNPWLQPVGLQNGTNMKKKKKKNIMCIFLKRYIKMEKITKIHFRTGLLPRVLILVMRLAHNMWF